MSTVEVFLENKTPIKILRSIKELREWRRKCLLASENVGFVATMGALHQGHLTLVYGANNSTYSPYLGQYFKVIHFNANIFDIFYALLVKNSLEENDVTIVSIFVNPAQFAPGEDLDSYPRTLPKDLVLLESLYKPNNPKSGVDAVFAPTVSEMYPSGFTLDVANQKGAFVEVKGLSHQLEGSIRPAFFRGVATVVTKLLNAVQPDNAYFGQKDIQQTVVIKRMVKDLLIPTTIRVVPIVREYNGLAMSSRNEYLSDDVRNNHAQLLYRALIEGENLYRRGVCNSKEILDVVQQALKDNSTENFKVSIDYISVADNETLDELETINRNSGAILSGAIKVPNKENGVTRIIDNVLLV
ncbi:pantoate--beta-alanine ligase [Nadsonia fulvescens var. elongata DSM 6958]|uniref:Pantoate--beta-alanine ligase n=1 Tax=Nadsonia fulvescens var. elongata DSM 6958 TaxID=857566 RepID=A0A1E3PPJ1_9ASCO|nr:pantoate--beta-alanine ligase [Nadsonia fulvescens var. elongata DSM 6958]